MRNTPKKQSYQSTPGIWKKPVGYLPSNGLLLNVSLHTSPVEDRVTFAWKKNC